MAREAVSPQLRFFAKVDFDGPLSDYRPDLGPCWLWTAYVDEDDYGRFWIGGRTVPAHRFAYEFCVGEIPDGLTLDHLCRVTFCVNPTHLEPVTSYENTMRGYGPSALAARATHCPAGHAYPVRQERKQRRCLQCLAIWQRQYLESEAVRAKLRARQRLDYLSHADQRRRYAREYYRRKRIA